LAVTWITASSAGARQIKATSASYIAMVTPIVAVFLGFTIGSEVLDPLGLGGAGITSQGSTWR